MGMIEQDIIVNLKEGSGSELLAKELEFLRGGKAHIQVEFSGLNGQTEALLSELRSIKPSVDLSEFRSSLRQMKAELSEFISQANRDLNLKVTTQAAPAPKSSPVTNPQSLTDSAFRHGIDVSSVRTGDAQVDALLSQAASLGPKLQTIAQSSIKAHSRVDRIVEQFKSNRSTEYTLKSLAGFSESTLRSVREREALELAQKHSRIPGVSQALVAEARNGTLPSAINPKNLSKSEVLLQSALGGLSGGVFGAGASLAGGLIGGAPGALVGQVIEQAIGQSIEGVTEKLREHAQHLKEAGLAYSEAVLSVTASLNQGAQVLRNGQAVSTTEGYEVQNQFARRTVQAASAELAGLGITGETAAQLTRVSQSSLQRKLGGSIPSPELTALTAKAFGGAFQVVDQPGLTSGRAVNIDVADILSGSSNAKTTQLGQRLPQEVLSAISRARTEEQIKTALSPLLKYSETFENATDPAAIDARLRGAQGQNTSLGGQSFTEATKSSQQFQEFVKKQKFVQDANKRSGQFQGVIENLFGFGGGIAEATSAGLINTAGNVFDFPGLVGDDIKQLLGIKDGASKNTAELRQSKQQGLSGELSRLGISETIGKFQSEQTVNALLAQLSPQEDLARDINDPRLAGILNAKRELLKKEQAGQLAGISTATSEGKLQSVAAQRSGVNEQIGVANQEVEALRAQLPNASGAELQRINGQIIETQNQILALKAREKDLSQQTFDQLTSSAQKIAGVFQFGSSASGIEAGRDSASGKLRSAVAGAQTREDGISARLSLLGVESLNPEAIRLGQQISGTSGLSFSGREKIAAAQVAQANSTINKNQDIIGRLTEENRGTDPNSSQTIANKIKIEELQAQSGAASVNRADAQRRQSLLPTERAAASAELNLALARSARTVEDEAAKRQQLNTQIQLSTAALQNFAERANAQSASKEVRIAQLSKKVRDSGGSVPGLNNITDDDIRQLQEKSDVAELNQLLAENGSLTRSVGSGLNTASTFTDAKPNSQFALAQQQEKAGLQEGVRDAKNCLSDLSEAFKQSAASLQRTVIDLRLQLGQSNVNKSIERTTSSKTASAGGSAVGKSLEGNILRTHTNLTTALSPSIGGSGAYSLHTNRPSMIRALSDYNFPKENFSFPKELGISGGNHGDRRHVTSGLLDNRKPKTGIPGGLLDARVNAQELMPQNATPGAGLRVREPERGGRNSGSSNSAGAQSAAEISKLILSAQELGRSVATLTSRIENLTSTFK